MARSDERAAAPTFEQAWAKKRRDGCQYGEDALEQVRFGWEMCMAELAAHNLHVVTDAEMRVLAAMAKVHARALKTAGGLAETHLADACRAELERREGKR